MKIENLEQVAKLTEELGTLRTILTDVREREKWHEHSFPLSCVREPSRHQPRAHVATVVVPKYMALALLREREEQVLGALRDLGVEVE